MIERSILLFLIGHQGRAPCSIRQAKLASLIGCSLRSINAAVRRLKHKKFLNGHRRPGRSNCYRFGSRLRKLEGI